MVKKRLEHQLSWDSRVNAENISVRVRDGRATIEGIVPSYSSKRAATEIARAVKGVKDIDNRLEVKYERPVADNQLKDNVESLLRWLPDIDSKHIAVNVDDGHVKLTGEVDEFWKKALLEADITNMIGVTEITNGLAVTPSDEMIDESIRKQILKRLKTEVGSKSIRVDVEEGEVQLSGLADSWTAKRSALDIAEQTGGVRNIYENIEVMA